MTSEWKKGFKPHVIEAGLLLFREGMVLSVQETGDVVVGRVQDSRAKPHNVFIRLPSGRKTSAPLVGMACTCPVALHCRHAAAVLHSLETVGTKGSQGKPEVRYILHASKSKGLLTMRANPVGRLMPQEGFGACAMPSVRLRMAELDTADRDILPGFYENHRFRYDVRRSFFLSGNVLIDSLELLRKILQSGHAVWKKADGPALAWREPRRLDVCWQFGADHQQKPLFFMPDQPDKKVALLKLGAGFCEADRTFFPPEISLPFEYFESLRQIKPVPIFGAEQFARDATLAHGPLPRGALPFVPEKKLIEHIDPVPHLKLLTRRREYFRHRYSRGYDREEEFQDYVLLSFGYNGAIVNDSAGTMPTSYEEGVLRIWKRNFPAENRAKKKLMDLGFEEADAPYVRIRRGLPQVQWCLPDPQEWVLFKVRKAPKLEEEGWIIQQEDSFRWDIEEATEFYAETVESSGMDWFGLEMGITIGGERVNLFPLLLAAMKQSKDLLSAEFLANADGGSFLTVSLPNGKKVTIAVERIRSILGVLLDLSGDDPLDSEGRLKMARWRALEIAQLERSGVEWKASAKLREFASRLSAGARVSQVTLPESFQATLRPYQSEGVEWMQGLSHLGLGGILADDMGLGKTVQALAHLAIEKASGRQVKPSLVVAPTSLMENWRAEAARWVPGLKVGILQGAKRGDLHREIGSYDLLLTTYPLLGRDFEVLASQEYHALILDEAQFIKNIQAKTSLLVRKLKSEQRFCLTGTPMENHLGELWSLFDFLLPGFLGGEKLFRRLFRVPIEKQGSRVHSDVLARRISPFLLRRTKTLIASELPEKTVIETPVRMNGAQCDLYESIRLLMLKKVRDALADKGIGRSRIIVLDALLKLRQVCCDPRLVKLSSAANVRGSAKLERLMEMVPEMIEEGRRILLFSQFTGMLDLIEADLRARNLAFVRLDGQTSDRVTPVRTFQAREAPLFLISLKAGGTGLNLTAADTVIHYDPWWNPAVEAQATDRAHRIGQDQKVFVYKLIVEGSVERRIMELQNKKRQIVSALLEGDANAKLQLTTQDIESLLGPIEQVLEATATTR